MSHQSRALAAVSAAANFWAASNDFRRAKFVLDNMTSYGIPYSWLGPLSAVKAAGAIGLLAGLRARPIGIAASSGLVAYYAGAIATVMRVRLYAHLGYPAPFLLLAVATLASQLRSRNAATPPSANQSAGTASGSS